MKVLIIEDEAPAFRRLEKLLREILPSIEILEVFDTVEDTVGYLKHHDAPELIFMDIQISDGISFQVFEQVEVLTPVIFTTAFDEYMLKAFKVNSIDYLLKPIKKDELSAALEKYQNLRHPERGIIPSVLNEVISSIKLGKPAFKSRFLVKQGDKMLSIKTQDIVCFQSKNGVVFIHTRGQKSYLSDFTLDELKTSLDPAIFFRANRQFILNIEFVATVNKYFKGKLQIELGDFTGVSIVVSVEKAASFKRWMDQ
ncbi:MAG: LytTR family DNA-binding domain-containing protein [Bacteroidota bacterium]